MKNVSVLLIGGELDGQTYTAREDEDILHIHFSEKKDVVTGSKVTKARSELPPGHFYVYKKEREGSNRFIYVKTE